MCLTTPQDSLLFVQLAKTSSLPAGEPLLTAPALAGFKRSDVFKAARAPDRLHGIFEGLMFNLLRYNATSGCLLKVLLERAIPNDIMRMAVLHRCAALTRCNIAGLLAWELCTHIWDGFPLHFSSH